MKIGIAGAGLMGRVIGTALLRAGHTVTLFDRDAPQGEDSCGAIGAGMLAPFCELESASPTISQLGQQALRLWPAFLRGLPTPVFFQQAGTLVVAHPNDTADLARFASRLQAHAASEMQWLDRAALRAHEPGLADNFSGGWFMAGEGQVDNQQLMAALAAFLSTQATWHHGVEVSAVEPGTIYYADQSAGFDWAIDARGLGARKQLDGLRGVRGEVIRLDAPDVSFQRPVRLMHPRYPLYVVPREASRYVIGASSIESDDRSQICVRSILELLSAAYALQPAFGEARVVSTAVQCRPAFADNDPRVWIESGRIVVNGLYRHGFLLAPVVADLVTRAVAGERPDAYTPLFL